MIWQKCQMELDMAPLAPLAPLVLPIANGGHHWRHLNVANDAI
jgi:hypothetical protein